MYTLITLILYLTPDSVFLRFLLLLLFLLFILNVHIDNVDSILDTWLIISLLFLLLLLFFVYCTLVPKTLEINNVENSNALRASQLVNLWPSFALFNVPLYFTPEYWEINERNSWCVSSGQTLCQQVPVWSTLLLFFYIALGSKDPEG